jgi:formylglycine-generating enzyme required for sulfatase activity
VLVDINDSGAGMKDEDGNLINMGGFIGQMSKYETTNAQYCEYLNAALADGLIHVVDGIVYAVSDDNQAEPDPYFDVVDSYSQITYDGTFNVRTRDGYSMDSHPVAMVSWYGATAFCDYYDYRLPTEWEWQAVADYDGSYVYGCGLTIDPNRANYDEANPLGLSSYPYTTPAGHYVAYGYGLCDMAGNMLEYTDSVYFGYCRLRGGSWDAYGYYCTVSGRTHDYRGYMHRWFGFRVCR